MPRLIKRKHSQAFGDGGGGQHQAGVDNLLKKQRLLMMSGKLPNLMATSASSNNDDATATHSSGINLLGSNVEGQSYKMGQNVAEHEKDTRHKGLDSSGGDAGQAGRRCFMDLGDETPSGFHKRLSPCPRRMATDGNDPLGAMMTSHHRAAFSGAKRAMSARLCGKRGQRSEVQGQGIRFDKESYGKMRIAALNASSSDESESEIEMEISKEAQESEAYSLYNKALDLQRAGSNTEAESTYKQLLNIPFLAKVRPPEKENAPLNPGLMLKYSTYKNLASMAYQRKDLNHAMEHYLNAVELDESDVTVWYRMGTISVSLLKLSMARLSFTQALKCSPKHWPSLDNVCTVTYALNDYANCLYFIRQALERDCNYKKGVVLREKIFKEQPSLRRDSYDMFRNCQDAIHPSRIRKAEAEQYIKEALTLREKKQALEKREPRPSVKFLTPFPSLSSFTWKGLGERLNELYDHLKNSPPPLSLSCKVDLSEFIKHPLDKTSMTSQTNDIHDTPLDETQDTAPAKTVAHDTGQLLASLQEVLPDSNVPVDDGKSSEKTHEDPQQITEKSHQQNETENENMTKITQTLEQDPQHTPQQTPLQHLNQVEVRPTEQTSQETTQDSTQESLLQIPQETPEQNTEQTQEKCSDNEDLAMETEEVPVKKKARRGPKRKRERAKFPIPGNRRSTRVRNTTAVKKKEESVNYQEILRQFLPSSLQNSDEGDISEQDYASDKDEINRRRSVNSGQLSTDPNTPIKSMDSNSDQSERVWQFLAARQRNSGVLQILDEYLQEIANTLPGKWPPGLAGVFVQAYSRSRCHVMLPNVFSSDYDQKIKTSIGYTMLANVELKLDQTTSRTPQNSASKTSDREVVSKFIDEDLVYMQTLSTSGSLLEEKWLDFTVRVHWVTARHEMLQGNTEVAINFFDVCTDILKDYSASSVLIPNCTTDNKITIVSIQDQLKSTQHSQSLEEVQRLYDAEDYAQVTTLLLPTFQDMTSSRKMLKEGTSAQRPLQMLLLHQALLKLQNYEQCIVCGAAAVCEALQAISAAKTSSLRDVWIEVLMEMFSILNKALCAEVDCLKQLERPQRVRFTSTVLCVVELCMDTDSGLPQEVLPWVVLYQVIKHEEDQIASQEIAMATQDDRGRCKTPMIPSSLMLLDTAHDYLGRRTWCCNSDGQFLRFYISVLSREIALTLEDDPHPFLSDLQYSLEQCFFCLHGHPNKKTKARQFQDHGVDELPMTLEDAGIIFDYFKPNVLPEFDSYKTSSMSSDLESLLLKIVRIIPAMDDPPVTMEMLQSYIEAKTDQPPSIPRDRPIVRPVVKEIYYLLADFYFKNKEFFKAIKLYMQDICVCPDRLDSWAGMALARSGRLEVKFNMCDSKTEGTIYKQSVAALRCFKRALEIDCTNRSLWIEYGSMAYMVHSYASRQLKQKEQFSLTEDIVEFLQEKRSECLGLAGKCFEEARGCKVEGNEEEWLVHYMLGKVAEKQRKEPKEFLEHYKKAAYYLYEDEAKYPKRINYHYPPDLSLEALEMYFRLHASILKLLEKPGFHGNYQLLEQYVIDAGDQPFVIALEKTDTSEAVSSTDNDQDIKSPIPTLRGQHEGKGQADVTGQSSQLGKPKVPGSPLFVATPTDHDYVRSRSKKRQPAVTTTAPSLHSTSLLTIETPASSSLQSLNQDAVTSAAELLKSLAQIHTESQDQSLKTKGHPQVPLRLEKGATEDLQDRNLEDQRKEGSCEPADVQSERLKKASGPEIDLSINQPSNLGTDKEMVKGCVLPLSRTQHQPQDERQNLKESCGSGMDEKEKKSRDGSRSPNQYASLTQPDRGMETSEIDEALKVSTHGKMEGTDSYGLTQETKTHLKLHLRPEMQSSMYLEVTENQPDENMQTAGYIGDRKTDPRDVGETEIKEGQTSIQDRGPEKEKLFEGPRESKMDERVRDTESRKINDEGFEMSSDSRPSKGFNTRVPEDVSMVPLKDFVSSEDLDKKRQIWAPKTTGNDRETSLDVHSETRGDNKTEEKASGTKIEPDRSDSLIVISSEDSDEPMDTKELLPTSETMEMFICGTKSGKVEVKSTKVRGDQTERESENDVSIITLSSAESESDVNQIESEDMEIGEEKPAGESKKDGRRGYEEEQKERTQVFKKIEERSAQTIGIQVEREDERNISIITISSGDSESEINSLQEEELEDVLKMDSKMEYAESASEDLGETSKTDDKDKERLDCVSRSEIAPDQKNANKDTTRKERTAEAKMNVANRPQDLEIEATKQNLEDDLNKVSREVDESKDNPKTDEKLQDELVTKNEGKTNIEQGSKDRACEDARSGDKCGRSQKETKAWLVEKCLEAMKLCLTRFPQHYKSLYRMSNAYSLTHTQKSLGWSRDLLLGSNQPWQQMSHMPSPGLFAEHWKTKNLFHGVWRIPITEIDRSGSFSWHMYRSVNLLIDVLSQLGDHTMLLQIAVKLNRTPELGKKFLRDVDRQYLARHCYKTCLQVLQDDINTAAFDEDKEKQMQAVFSCYQLVQTVQNKLQLDSGIPTRLLCAAYRIFQNIQAESDVAVLEQAVRFCLQNRLMTSRTPQIPSSL